MEIAREDLSNFQRSSLMSRVMSDMIELRYTTVPFSMGTAPQVMAVLDRLSDGVSDVVHTLGILGSTDVFSAPERDKDVERLVRSISDSNDEVELEKSLSALFAGSAKSVQANLAALRTDVTAKTDFQESFAAAVHSITSFDNLLRAGLKVYAERTNPTGNEEHGLQYV